MKKITDSYRWSGKLESLPALINALCFAGLSRDIQVKLVTLTGAVRISDYTTRATCQPGECFWLEDDVICSGDHTDWQEAREKANAAVDNTNPPSVQHVSETPSPEPLGQEAAAHRRSAG